ncbi:restriction endonuclease [Selenomonas timonae]|uniref:Restriction endonuclease n=1 Tax=Selenomonas timonae TaxID=2754044 RepID=A0A7G7VKV2_9FIRM|nr:restriction endonuclease [Selenomonas timonae]QNH54745.1 restriction endonuclease [Selenomonas timonae]
MTRKKKQTKCPDYRLLIEPTWYALVQLGGSGTNSEIDAEIIRQLGLSDEIVDEPHKETGNETELEYRAKWARTYLKKYGLIENSARGVWSIAPQYQKMVEQVEIDKNEIIRTVRQQLSPNRNDFADNTNEQGLTIAEVPDERQSWERRLSGILMEMNPYGFEKLAQRLLRECGFSQVTVTKKSGDGGIDGNGKLKVNGVLTFNVAFQCKRYKGVVGAADIRDFRGSLTTDIEKGIFITTGTFSKAARDEAVSPGKQQIDLIDGEELVQKLAEYNIGLYPVNSYEIDEEYFMSL